MNTCSQYNNLEQTVQLFFGIEIEVFRTDFEVYFGTDFEAQFAVRNPYYLYLKG